MKRMILMGLFSVIMISINQAQPSTLATNFTAGNYKECVVLSEELLKKDPDNAQAHFFKGAALARLQDYIQSEKSLKKALKLNYQPVGQVNASLLRAYAGLKKTEQLLHTLETMTVNGFGAIALLNSDEFSYLENNQDFVSLKQEVDKNANPCKYGEQFQRLDFWIGEWDVYVNNNKVADNTITKSFGACSLHEDYRTQSGFSGTSISYYDPVDSLYKQTWIDKFNSIIQFWEVKSEAGFLQMHAKGQNNNLVRMTYVYDEKKDEVTQSMENSSDEGKTWATTFVGVYKRKK